MNMITKFFAPKTTITSDTIRVRLADAEAEIATHRAKLGTALAGVAAMSDAEHVKIEGEIAATERAITRLESLVAHLNAELPDVNAAEEAAAKAAADEALVRRAKAATKASNAEAKVLLAAYADHAAAIADILAKLKAIESEREAVNVELSANPVYQQPVASFNDTHRSTGGVAATEQRAMVAHWVYRDHPAQPNEVYPGETESSFRATFDEGGNPINPGGVVRGRFGQIITPVLEQREVITTTRAQPARHEAALDEVRLPPAFAAQPYFWPRS